MLVVKWFGIPVVSIVIVVAECCFWLRKLAFLVWFSVGFAYVVCGLIHYLICCWLLDLRDFGVLGLMLVLLVCCGLVICLVGCWFPSITFAVDYCG